MKFLKGSFVVFLTAAIALNAAGQQALPPSTLSLSLREAVKRALGANRSAARARADITVAEQARRQLRSSVLPQFDFSGNLTRNSEEVQFGSGEDTTTLLPLNDWQYRFTVSQPIYAGLREAKTLRQAGFQIDNSREALRSTEDAVLLGVTADYLGIVTGDALVDVEKRNITLAERRLKQARDFYEAGEVTRVDTLRAEAALKGAQRRLAAAVQQRETAASRMRLGLAVDGELAIEDPAMTLPPMAEESRLLEIAEGKNPQVIQAQNNLAIANLEVSKQRAAYLPVLTADAAYITQKTDFPTSEYGQVSLRFSVPIFHSGEFSARIAGARARQKQAELALDEARQTVREDVRLALLDLRTAETSLGLAREQLAASEAEYEQTFELYRAQEATSLDTQVAESSLAEARRAVVESTLNRWLAELRVWFSTGELKNALMTEEVSNES